jgi:hypothetical protein
VTSPNNEPIHAPTESVTGEIRDMNHRKNCKDEEAISDQTSRPDNPDPSERLHT